VRRRCNQNALVQTPLLIGAHLRSATTFGRAGAFLLRHYPTLARRATGSRYNTRQPRRDILTTLDATNTILYTTNCTRPWLDYEAAMPRRHLPDRQQAELFYARKPTPPQEHQDPLSKPACSRSRTSNAGRDKAVCWRWCASADRACRLLS
jgi:hypothetical protein